MAVSVKIILNPVSGRWSEQVKIDKLKPALLVAGLDYALETSKSIDHCLELAARARQEGWPVVVAAGGDSTISSVANGLIQAGGENEVGTLGIIPFGTANDLADMLGLPRDTTAACRRLAAGNTRLIDVGQVNGRYFVNNSAIGLEPMVTLTQDQMRWVKGELRYLLAALKVIATAAAWSMRLTWDSGEYTGPAVLVSVGNSPRTGGVFYMTPKAVLDDGLLDFVYAQGLNRRELLTLLPKTFKGEHIHHPRVANLKTTFLAITTSPGTPIQADGEVFAKNAIEINYRIIPQKLRVIV
ncbi:MAG: diacylglycerol kinase family lipid kinase [Anaerolineae bacterium]|nr:diacylglycerol kinase family lipid kinase [Anaerolineae bacterium]